MPAEVLFGFLGLVIGALFGVAGDFYINQRRMRFEAYKDIKVVLSKMHGKLVESHSKIQQYYNDDKTDNPRNRILNLKEFHWSVMEIYKDFRIYFGDLKAYELESAVYNYYYEYAKADTNDDKLEDQFFHAYQALKDAYGLMISEVKLGLVSVNFIAKVNRKLRRNRYEEYGKYSNRLHDTIKQLSPKISAQDNCTAPAFVQAVEVVRSRISSFEEEYEKKVKKPHRLR